MVEKNHFDSKFRKLFTTMVEIAFEFVDRNTTDIDSVYVFGSMEEGDFFYNVLYRINGKLVYPNEINDVSKHKYNLSDDRIFKLFELGKSYLASTYKLFKEYGREVPTTMKMVYSPQTGAFDNDIIYEPQYSHDDDKIVSEAFDEWYEELKGSS